MKQETPIFLVTHLNKRQHDILLPLLIKKQTTIDGDSGYYCNWCGAKPATLTKNHKDSKLVIDRIDNYKFGYSVEKCQLLCRGCNKRKNPTIEDGLTGKPMSHSERKNMEAEPKARAYIINRMVEFGELDFEENQYAIAEKYDCNPVTAARYIRKLGSTEGPLKIVKGVIYWRHEELLTKEKKEEYIQKYVEGKSLVCV